MLGDANRLSSDELRFEVGFAILKQHGDDLSQVGLQLLQGFALAVRSTETGNVPYEEACFSVTFDDGCK